jgi:DNA-binding transcriptional MerR regulator
MIETAGAAELDKAPDAFRTISEVADELDVPQHVLRFWETRFQQIKPMKRGGGRRYYRPDDVDLLRGIRHLLYGEGYTIRGVQRIFKDSGIKFVQSVWKSGAPQPESRHAEDAGETDEEAAAALVEPSLPAGRIEPNRGPASLDQAPHPARDPPVRQMPRSNLQPVMNAAVPAPRPSEPEQAPTPMAAHTPLFTGENLRKLQSTLYDLGECRRLLDAALNDE